MKCLHFAVVKMQKKASCRKMLKVFMKIKHAKEGFIQEDAKGIWENQTCKRKLCIEKLLK